MGYFLNILKHQRHTRFFENRCNWQPGNGCVPFRVSKFQRSGFVHASPPYWRLTKPISPAPAQVTFIHTCNERRAQSWCPPDGTLPRGPAWLWPFQQRVSMPPDTWNKRELFVLMEKEEEWREVVQFLQSKAKLCFPSRHNKLTLLNSQLEQTTFKSS